MILRAHQSGKEQIEKAIILKKIKDWKPPIHALDFETLTHGIPRFKGAHVAENIPFQFSAFISDSNGKAREVAYLHPDGTDPRKDLAEALLKAFPDKGSIAAYNGSFEKDCIELLATHNPKLSKKLKALSSRIVDPYRVLEGAYYDAGFNFSYRLKSVAPVILGKSGSYENLAIQGGSSIQAVYDEYVDPNCSPKRKEELSKNLLLYCAQDSKVTLEIVKWLFKKVGKSL
jgi:hypothetical protein